MIEPNYLTLTKLFSDRVFRIPQYQRFYSWTSKQRDDLFGDIQRLSERPGDDHHFMATVVCFRTKEQKTIGSVQYRLYDVVDGQQRLTTLIVLLKCILMLMPEGSELDDERKELSKLLVKKDTNLILLQSNNANQHIFNQFLRHGTQPTNEDITTEADKRLAAAMKECREFAEKWSERPNGLVDLLTIIKNRLGFVVYDTEEARLVYSLFEVLNSRGLPVDWLDKCKSLLMGAVDELAKTNAVRRARTEALQDIWGQIYRALAEVSLSGEQVLRVTATLRHGASRGKPQSADESLTLFRSECTDISIPELLSLHLLDVAKKLVSLEKNIEMGPVTRILHARILAVALQSTKTLNETQRRMALSQWERTTFRIFGLFGKDSRWQVGDYVRLAERVMNESKATFEFGGIMEELRNLGADFPAKEAAKVGLGHLTLYEDDPEMCRYILWRYEEFLAEASGKGSTIDPEERRRIWKLRAADSIEHIYPQNPAWDGSWDLEMKGKDGSMYRMWTQKDRLGNLVLLPIPLNSEAQRKGFREKKSTYQKHHLRQIQEITTKRNWTLKDIETREAKMIKWAATAWADLA